MAIKKRPPYLGLHAVDHLTAARANRYQAVLAAAKMARRLNDVKVADFDAQPEAERTIQAHKVTSMALEMLLRGEIEYHVEKSDEEAPPNTVT